MKKFKRVVSDCFEFLREWWIGIVFALGVIAVIVHVGCGIIENRERWKEFNSQQVEVVLESGEKFVIPVGWITKGRRGAPDTIHLPNGRVVRESKYQITFLTERGRQLSHMF